MTPHWQLPKLRPDIGGGLSRLSAAAAVSAAPVGNPLYNKKILNRTFGEVYMGSTGTYYLSLGFTPKDIRNVVFSIRYEYGYFSGSMDELIFPEFSNEYQWGVKNMGGSYVCNFGLSTISTAKFYADYPVRVYMVATEYDAKVKSSGVITSTSGGLNPFTITNPKNTYVKGIKKASGFTSSDVGFFGGFMYEYSDTAPVANTVEGDTKLRITSATTHTVSGLNVERQFSIIEWEQ